MIYHRIQLQSEPRTFVLLVTGRTFPFNVLPIHRYTFPTTSTDGSSGYLVRRISYHDHVSVTLNRRGKWFYFSSQNTRLKKSRTTRVRSVDGNPQKMDLCKPYEENPTPSLPKRRSFRFYYPCDQQSGLKWKKVTSSVIQVLLKRHVPRTI